MPKPTDCPFCGAPGKKTTATRSLRHGERSLAYKVALYQCPESCLDPETDRVFSWMPTGSLIEADRRARREWEKKYGEAVPERR